ncbi:envelope stress response membrane protein PspC [Aerophototrophica crusticola]
MPPPFPGRRRYRVGGRSGRDWQEDYLGKPRDMSWGEYLGLDGAGFDTGRKARGERGSGDRAAPRAAEDPSMTRMEPIYRSPNPHKLYRNTAEGKLGGVCAGIADYLNVDSWIIRLAVVLGFFFFSPVVLVGYAVLWWILKPRPRNLYETKEEEVFWRSVATKPDQTLAGLKAKFREMDRVLGRIEGYVASKEYDLHRQFRDLERK